MHVLPPGIAWGEPADCSLPAIPVPVSNTETGIVGATVFATEPRDILHDASFSIHLLTVPELSVDRVAVCLRDSQHDVRSDLRFHIPEKPMEVHRLGAQARSPPSISLIDVLTLAKAGFGDNGGA